MVPRNINKAKSNPEEAIDRMKVSVVSVSNARRFAPRAAYAARYARSGREKYIKLLLICEADRGP